MTPSIKIIERIEHDSKARKPIHVELAVFDVRMVRRNFRARLKPLRNFFRNLVHLVSALQGQKHGYNTGTRALVKGRRRRRRLGYGNVLGPLIS
jgi:hypothetical protein